MGLFNKYKSNNIEYMLQNVEYTPVSLKIALKKKPDYTGGLNFEKLVYHFYDHIKIDSYVVRNIWEKYMSNDYSSLYCITSNSKLTSRSEWTFPMLYILDMCNKWGICCHLCKSNCVKGWALNEEEEDYIIMRIFMEIPHLPFLKSYEGSVGNFLLTHSLIAYILENVISKEAEVYFRNNLEITSLICVDEERVNEIFKDNISPSELISAILNYEKEEDKKKEKNNGKA